MNFRRAAKKDMKNRGFFTVDRRSTAIFPAFPASRAYLAHEGQQTLARQPQVGHCKESDDLPRVLFESAVANLHEAKLALDDSERMFNDGTDRRQNPVGLLLLLVQFATLRFLGRHQNSQTIFGLKILQRPIFLEIAAISEGNFLFAVQTELRLGQTQLLHSFHRYVRGCRDNGAIFSNQAV